MKKLIKRDFTYLKSAIEKLKKAKTSKQTTSPTLQYLLPYEPQEFGQVLPEVPLKSVKKQQ